MIIYKNNSDRLKEFNQGHNRKAVKVLTLDDFDLKGKTVFLRVDMNCPIDPETMEFWVPKELKKQLKLWNH